jgi:hypothetical protein
MANVKNVISRHNNHILSKSTTTSSTNIRLLQPYNNPSECPIKKNCKSKNIIYKAQVTWRRCHKRVYIGMTATTLKERYGNHKKSFKLQRYKNDTERSKYICMGAKE